MGEKVVISLGTITAVFLFLHRWYGTLKTILEPIVKDAEQRAKDGIIDKTDRKELALALVAQLQVQGKIKLNFITKFIVGHVINHLAEKLPDFTFTKDETIKDAPKPVV